MWSIKKSVLLNACSAASNYLPTEFMCLLGGDSKKQLIDALVIIPTDTHAQAAYFNELTLPFDPTIIGSLHSHPYSHATPSSADARVFSKYPINVILGHPYDIHNACFFDAHAQAVEVMVIEG